MARRRQPVAPIPTPALVASSIRLSGKAARIYQGLEHWQTEVYRHFSICGEARYAATYYGHCLSKASLYAADVGEDGTEVRLPPDSEAAMLLKAPFSGRESEAAMLKAAGMHLSLAGEFYLIGRSLSEQEKEDMPPGAITDEEVWEVVAVTEVRVKGNRWSIVYRDDRRDIDLSEDDVVIRVWSPRPGARMKADSPFRSLLPVLSEIEWLTKHIFAQVSSRLTGAGILFLPKGMSFPAPPPDADGNEQQFDNEADAFLATLAEAMLTPLNDDDSPARVVPTVATVPADMVDKPKLLHFWSQLDEKALEMRNDAIKRFARGMDLPPEKVLGISSNSGTGGGTSNGVSHWGAWQIDEDTVKLHIEPMLELLANTITVSYLRPLTGGNERVRADTTDLRLRPDRSKEAIMLWDRFAITTVAMLREVGFEDADALNWDTPEFKARLVVKIAGGSATPEQVQAANRILGIDLGASIEEQQAPTREARPAPSLEDKPVRELPEAASSRVLLAACEPLVFRGLERAGNRLRGAVGKAAPPCPSYETHLYVPAKDPDHLLDDAWSCAEAVLDGISDDVQGTISVLDSYVRCLLSEQAPHSRARLQQWLSLTAEAV